MTESELKQLKAQLRQPLIPLPDNFTPRERTPWGGTRLAEVYKNWLNLPKNLVLGESWEISGHRAFPSRFSFEFGKKSVVISLPEILEHFPKMVLGEKIDQKFQHQMPLLVKLLDTAANLSVQVHPDDHYPKLKPGEMGKNEAWYIVAADTGRGIYLGFEPGVTASQLRHALAAGADISSYLHFVPVQPGEVYFIPAGTVHAIGQGLTLIESQQTSETTYRFWDWNRRYNARGELAEDGQPRPLHLEDAFAVTQFQGRHGAEFIQKVKSQPRLIFEGDGNIVQLLLTTPYFQIEKLVLTNPAPLFMAKDDFFQAFVVLNGQIEIQVGAAAGTWRVGRGQSLLLPAAVSEFQLALTSPEPAELLKIYYPIS
ncbi:class I mannose-6-phosphate isomerase [candidate division KSB1 bacterium]|nr:class I mannose-6-phosphate isomerase [candidate division KSB1 bacterium]